MTKKRVTEVYRFLSAARMGRLNDDEKVAVIRLLREMKPVAAEIQDAATESLKKASDEYPDDMPKAMMLAEQAIADLLNAEVDIDTHILTAEAYERLCFSNDWTFAQMEELGDVLTC